MSKLVNKHLYFFVLFYFNFVNNAQHIMQLPNNILEQIGLSVLEQSAPNVILADQSNEDEQNIAEIHKKYTVLCNANNGFNSLKLTNKKLFCIFHKMLNYYDLIKEAECSTVCPTIFFQYCLRNIQNINSSQHIEEEIISLTTLQMIYQQPFKPNFLANLFGWKPTFPEEIQADVQLIKRKNSDAVYCVIQHVTKNYIGYSFAQKRLHDLSGNFWVAFLSQLLDQKAIIIEQLYPFMQFNPQDTTRSTLYYKDFESNEKKFLGGLMRILDKIEIKDLYIIDETYTIPISKIPLSVFFNIIKKSNQAVLSGLKL